MRIAIFHNFLDNIGGAEIVTLTLARELDADVYTTNINKDMIKKMGFDTVRIHSIGKVPINAPFRQQCTLLRFYFLRLRKNYDAYIIAGDWAVSAAVHNKPAIWYVHSPIREIWDLYLYVRTRLVSPLKRPLFDVWVWLNRILNKRCVRHIAVFLCNSKNTQRRVKKYLHKSASVIYPPIDTKNMKWKKSHGYWLSVNRINTQKRIDIQCKAFAHMSDEKLIIVGSYEQSSHFIEEKKRITSLAPKNVKILHWVTVQEMGELYSHAKGFITTAKDEDFGMTAVEAMAAGKPVIAPYEGGYRESVIEGKTGMFLHKVTPKALIAVVKKIGPHAESYRTACEQQAKKYDTAVFVKNIRTVLENEIQSHEKKYNT